MNGLRWALAGAFAAAATGLFLPWVRAGSLSVRGIHTTPGVIYLLVLVLALIFGIWHGVRTSNYWYSLEPNRVTGSLLSLSWLVLLAVAVYESVHLASSHSPSTGRAEVLGIGLAIATMAALVGSVVATIDAVGNWSQSQTATSTDDAKPSEETATPQVTRIGMLRPIGAWATAAIGILAVAGAGLAGHDAGWTPIARPVSHTTHRSPTAHGGATSRPPTSGSPGSPTTGPASSTTTTTPASGSNPGSPAGGTTGTTGNTGAALPGGAPTPPVGIGNTPIVPGVTPTTLPPSVGSTGTTGTTGSTGSTGSTGNTP